MRHFILTLFTFFFIEYSFSQDTSSLSTSELIINSSIRIECSGDTTIDSRRIGFTSTGTGFYFEFKFDSIRVPVIITNFHVIENTKTGILGFIETSPTRHQPMAK